MKKPLNLLLSFIFTIAFLGIAVFAAHTVMVGDSLVISEAEYQMFRVRFVNHEDGVRLDNEVYYGASFELPNVETGRNEYTFAGWLVDGELRFPETVITIKSDVLITGSWVRAYTITFTHGFEHNNRTSFVLGEAIVLTEAVRPGFAFNGWWTADVGGYRIEEITGSGDVTVWARWSVATTQFAIVLHNVTVAERNNPVVFTMLGDLPLRLNDALPRDGYKFDGWWTAPTGGTQKTEITVAADIRLYARWESYSENVVGGGGTTNLWLWLAVGLAVGVAIWIVLWFTVFKRKFAQANYNEELNLA